MRFKNGFLSALASPVLVRRCALACALVAVQGLAAATTVTLSQFPPNPGVLPGGGWQFTSGTTFANPPPQRAWVNGVYGSVPKIVATDTMTLAGRAGPLVVQAAQRVGVAEAAGAVARCLAGAVPVCAAATAAALLYEGYKVYRSSEHAGSPNCAGSDLCADPGADPQTQTVTKYRVYTSEAWVSSPSAACTAAGATYIGTLAPGMVRELVDTHVTGSAPYVCNIEYRERASNCPQSYCWTTQYNYPTIASSQQQDTSCPASIDASNPAYSVPAGEQPGLDGKCRTGRYNHVPITPAAAGQRVTDHVPSDLAQLRDALRQSIDQGGQQVPAEISVTGPQSQTGTPQTVQQTTPQGTTTTTTTPTYNYSYDGDRITYQTTITTNTCTGAGSCTTENASTSTTTTEAPPTEQDPKDPCTASPTRAGCVKLGEPTEAEVPKETKPFEVTPIVLASAACPAAVSFTAFGHGYQFEFQPMCDAASTWIRAVVLVCGAALAAFVFVGGLKT